MTTRGVSAVFLSLVFLAVACARQPETAGTTSAEKPAVQATSQASAPASAQPASKDEPDPFEMTAPPPPADPKGPCVLSRKLGPNGEVAGAEVSFATGDPIYLTVHPKQGQSEVKLQIVDHWGAEMRAFSGPVNKATNSVTFPIRDLKHGRYRVMTHGPDTLLCELAFEVR